MSEPTIIARVRLGGVLFVAIGLPVLFAAAALLIWSQFHGSLAAMGRSIGSSVVFDPDYRPGARARMEFEV